MSESPEIPTSVPEPGVRSRGALVAVLVFVVLVLAVGGVVLATSGDDGERTLANAAPCGEVITRPTDQTQAHTTDEDFRYADAPPSFGPHFGRWEPFGRAFYSDDRPPVSHLVHNLEHGYTIAWYDETAARDDVAMDELAKIAQEYQNERKRFIAVPWRSSDGGPFPDGMHIALTRWTADPADPANLVAQRGNWLYCGGIDPAAIADFFERFPNLGSPEPGIPLE